MKKRDRKEIERIQSTIPHELLDKLMVTRKVTPTISKVIDMAIKEKSMDDEKREELIALKETGKFDVTEQVVNKTVEKKIDDYVTHEMYKSVRAGRLAPPKNGTLLDKYIKKCKRNIKKSFGKD